MADEKYPKSRGAGGQKGVDYQVNLLAMFALEGLSLENWKLSTEHKLAGKFDDIVFQIDGDGDYLMQCKHKEKMQSVSRKDFFSTNTKNSDFALAKYFDSFLTSRDQFETKLLIICSNIGPNDAEDIFKKESTTAPPFQKVKHSHCLKDLRIDEVKEFLNQIKPSEEHLLAEFCEKLRFFHITDEEINKSINDDVAVAEDSLKLKFDRNEFISNMNQWFLADNGTFIKRPHVKAFLYEICSQKYSEELNEHDIHFKQNYNVCDNKIINVIPGKGDFLNILKIHRTLKENYRNTNILFINGDAEVMKEMIESFELLRFTIVFISLSKLNQYSEIYSRLKTILMKYDFKKAFILSEKPIQTDLPKTCVIEDGINFTDLTDTCQQSLLSKSVIFQGKHMSVQELIGDWKNIDALIDQEITIDLLYNREIEIGSAIKDLEDIQEYYIERTFTFKTEKDFIELTEKDMCDLSEKSGKFILISDGAGMGKSTILTKLGCLIKEIYPSLFLVRIDLNMFTSIFDEFQMASQMSIQLEDVLKSKGVDYFKKSFEQKIFLMTNKIILMVDSVDEISPDYNSLVKNFLLQTSKRENIFKIFVTSRPHLTMDLESFLETKSYELRLLSKPEQIDFLQKFWKRNLNIDNENKQNKCEIYAKTLIDKIGIAIGNTSSDFIGIPLQTRMIADIFEGSEVKKYEWTCCKDYLEAENRILKFPEKLIMVKLYDMFVEKKREIFIYDKCNTQGNVATKKIVSKEFDVSINECHKLAAELLFKDYERLLLDISKYANDTSRDIIIKIGIMTKFGNQLLFIHRTFAEYFVAKTLWAQLKELKKSENSEKFLVFLLGTVLVERRFEMIQTFFESILINESDQIRGDVLEICGTTVNSIAWDGTKNINVLAREGCKHILKLIMENIDDIRRKQLLNIVDKKTNRTALMEAIKFSEVVKFLLDMGADINKKSRHGRTVLHHAALENADSMELLLERGADINIADNLGITALYYSIITAKYDITSRNFYLLINQGTHHWNMPARFGTALIAAVNINKIKIVEELTLRGADINQEMQGGLTALHFAAANSSVDILVHLLERGANVNKQYENGWTAIHAAISENNFECLKILIERGVDVNIRDIYGATLLHHAAFKGSVVILAYLLERGENVNDQDEDGNTAVIYAIHKKYLDCLKLLVERGADVNIKNETRDTALHWAASEDSVDILAYLIEKGANVNDQNVYGHTAIHCSIVKNNLDGFKLLVEKGADVNIKIENGQTVMHYAASKGSVEILVHLLVSGANVHERDDDGNTAAYYAVRNNKLACLKVLVEKGIDINQK